MCCCAEAFAVLVAWMAAFMASESACICRFISSMCRTSSSRFGVEDDEDEPPHSGCHACQSHAPTPRARCAKPACRNEHPRWGLGREFVGIIVGTFCFALFRSHLKPVT